jgi:beta-carotene hydroxylase
MDPVKRPRIPTAWYRPSLVWTATFLTYAPLLVAVPATMSRLALAHAQWWPLRLLVMVPCTVVAAYGFQLMGFVGHEGMHLSLTKNKLVSACIGLFYASSVVSYFEMGFAAQHWTHHRFTNMQSDPDIEPVTHLDTWWKRLLLARLTFNVHYAATTIRLAAGGDWPFKYRIPFKKRTIQRLAMANLVFGLTWIGGYITIFVIDRTTALVCVALPMTTTLLISGCQTFLDHAGVGDEPYRNAWSRTSLGMTLVYFGANYHLEHHLYPGVPCYRLWRVHALLRDQGVLDAERAAVQASFWGAYAALAKPYRLGRYDADFDPFLPAT